MKICSPYFSASSWGNEYLASLPASSSTATPITPLWEVILLRDSSMSDILRAQLQTVNPNSKS
eukprot:CAMPEP_0184310796 /NCGR_PEP_ID=MMETSP1049-20130417/34630_1 /TAXON_ID=77928 /ORGANISM="Proteomonas sulcata, Strain CCMP704" /LENGTH=62 /DNA_ID=CAMNT_0026625451 /DNA_START=225 /DNA_END=413 /DNA_ORIENTATION=+